MTRHFRQRLPKIQPGYRREIVKIQRNDVAHNKAQVLITNEDKSVTVNFPLDDTLKHAFGNDYQQYWVADVPEVEGELKLLKITKEQAW